MMPTGAFGLLDGLGVDEEALCIIPGVFAVKEGAPVVGKGLLVTEDVSPGLPSPRSTVYTA